MVDRFRKYIELHKLVPASSKVIAAVSGGLDSMAMLSLLLEAGYKPSVAHCNFSLRGAESDGDQKLVEDFCAGNSLACFTKRFDTEGYAAGKRVSIQMAARELRYSWFSELSAETGAVVAVAHNSDDIIETLLVNLSRGTGLRGLTGIKPRNGHIIRPLLFASRDEIEQYAGSVALPWREDSSNSETYYTRNKIRHTILPIFEELNPSFRESAAATIERLNEADTVLGNYFDSVRRGVVKAEGKNHSVSIDLLLSFKPRNIHIYEIFSQFGISPAQVGEIGKLVRSGPGKQLVTTTHTIYKDRHHLIITPSEESQPVEMVASSPEEIDSLPGFSCRTEKADGFNIDPSAGVACLDLDKVEFPVTVRLWNDGDRLMPLGMRGFKKVSDLLTDLKIPAPYKAATRVLVSGTEIIWVAGIRIDNRYRITPETRNILVIKLL